MKKSMHARRMERQHRRNKYVPKLNLVSLMDIFTILVFFLLVNSSDVEVLQTNKSIKLPESIADKKPEANLVVMVSDDDIVIKGRQIVTVEKALDGDDEVIKALDQELKYLASRKPYRDEQERKEGRDVTVMGDAEIPYKLLKRIMATCAGAEYRNISLAVSQKNNNDEQAELAEQEGAAL